MGLRVGDAKKRLPLASPGVDEDIRDPAAERALLDALDVPLKSLGCAATDRNRSSLPTHG